MSVEIIKQENIVIELEGEPKTLVIQGVGMPGEGLIAGGLTGEVLAKKSDLDFDTEWVDLSTQMIVKSIIFG